MRSVQVACSSLLAIAVTIVFSCSAFLVSVSNVHAQTVGVPDTISYQGRLKDSTGAALTGTYDFIFELYTASSGGTATATETVDDVTVTAGYFTTSLDFGTDIADFANNVFLDIQVKADADGSYERMTTRVALSSVAYSMFTRAVENSAGEPVADLFAGRMVFDTTATELKVYDGSSWLSVSAPTLDDAYNNFGGSGLTVTLDDDSTATALEFDVAATAHFEINLSSTGDFLIQDNDSTFATFADDGDIDFDATAFSIDTTEASSTAVTINTGGTGGLDIDTSGSAFGVSIATGTTGFDVNASGAIALDGTGDSNFTVAEGDIAITVSDTANGNDDNIVITVGNDATASSVAGNDFAVDAEGEIFLNAGGGITLDTVSDVDFDIGGEWLVDAASGGISLDATAASNFSTSEGDLTFQVTNAAGADVVIVAGDAATSAGEDGNDIALEAEDDLLVEVGDGIDIDAVGGVTIDSTGGSISLDAFNTSNFITQFGDLTIATTDAASSDLLLTAGNSLPSGFEAGDDVSLKAEDDVLVRATQDFEVNVDQGIIFSAAAGAFDVDTVGGAIQLDAAAASNFTTTSGDLSFVANADGASVVVTAGDAPPSAGEDGDDVAIEAEDDVLVEASGNFSADASGSVLLTSSTGVASIQSTLASVILTAQTTLDLNSATDIDVDATAGDITIDAASGLISLNAGGDDLTLSASSDATDVIISAGDGAPSAGEDGNDVAIEAEDDILLEATGAFDVDAGANVSISSTTSMALNPTGVFSVNGSDRITFTTDVSNASAISLTSDDGGIDITATGNAGDDIDLFADGGSMTLIADEGAADALVIRANTGAGGIDIDSGTSGTLIDSTGTISLDAAAASNFTTTSGDLTLNASSDATDVIISAGDGAPSAGEDGNDVAIEAEDDFLVETTDDVNIDAGGLVAIDSATTMELNALGALTLLSDASAAQAIFLETTDGGIDLLATGNAGDDIDITSSGGSINLTSSENAADALTITTTAVAAGIDIDSGTSGTLIDSTGTISLDAAAASNFTTTSGDLTLNASSDATDVIISAGDGAPSAGEDGNDVAIEAEDDFLVETTDDVNIDAGGLLAIDATDDISITASGASPLFTISSGGTLPTTPAVSDDLELLAEDDIYIAATGEFGVEASEMDFAGLTPATANGFSNDIEFRSDDDFIVSPTSTGKITFDGASNVNWTDGIGGTGFVEVLVDAGATTGGETQNGLFVDFQVLDDANNDQEYAALKIELEQDSVDTGDVVYGLFVENTSASEQPLDSMIAIENSDTLTATNGIEFVSGNYSDGIVFTAGTFTNALDLSGGSFTDEIVLGNGETINNNTDGTVLIEDGGSTTLISASTSALSFNLGAQTGSGQRICQDGADASTGVEAIGDCDSGGADLAEFYGSDGTLEPGDLVVASGEAEDTLTKTGRHSSKAYVAKASYPNQTTVIGIISTSPNETYGEGIFDEDEHPVAVTLVGRVPLKVTNENGPIQTGDRLTASSIPGYAAKAIEPGWTIGTALGSSDNPDDRIIAFSSIAWFEPDESEDNQIQGGNNNIGDLLQLNVLNTTKLVVEGDAEIGGSLLVKEHLYGGADLAGRARINTGDDRVYVAFDKEYAYQPIVTATLRTGKEIPGYWWVEEESTTGFWMYLDGTLPYPVEFNWIAVGVDGGTVSVSDGSQQHIEVYVVDGGEPEEFGDEEPVEEPVEEEPIPEEEPPVEEEESEEEGQGEPPVEEEEEPAPEEEPPVEDEESEEEPPAPEEEEGQPEEEEQEQQEEEPPVEEEEDPVPEEEPIEE